VKLGEEDSGEKESVCVCYCLPMCVCVCEERNVEEERGVRVPSVDWSGSNRSLSTTLSCRQTQTSIGVLSHCLVCTRTHTTTTTHTHIISWEISYIQTEAQKHKGGYYVW